MIAIKAVSIAVVTITTIVEPNNSSFVDHDTFPNSAFTSFIKFTGFCTIFIFLFFQNTGAAGLEPAVTVLETVGLPLTDAPIIYLVSLCGVCL